MNNEEKLSATKKTDKISCPHCKQLLYVTQNVVFPSVSSVMTPEDVGSVKKEIVDRLDEINFSSLEEFELLLSYINQPDIVFDRSDIEPLLKNISVDQLKKIQEKKKV